MGMHRLCIPGQTIPKPKTYRRCVPRSGHFWRPVQEILPEIDFETPPCDTEDAHGLNTFQIVMGLPSIVFSSLLLSSLELSDTTVYEPSMGALL